MSAGKLQNEGEFRRWYEEGRSYQWIIDKYWTKYGIEIGHGTISNWRHRLGLERRQIRDLNLIPWKVEREHRISHDLNMLRVEGRRRSGAEVAPRLLLDLDGWKRGLEEAGEVVHYNPKQGWTHVKRRPGVDTDLIRVPDHTDRERGIRE